MYSAWVVASGISGAEVDSVTVSLTARNLSLSLSSVDSWRDLRGETRNPRWIEIPRHAGMYY
jgi:hypothetical protein